MLFMEQVIGYQILGGIRITIEILWNPQIQKLADVEEPRALWSL